MLLSAPPKNWRGVYNHWDSYPTGLGRELWNHLQTVLRNGTTLEGFARELLTYDDWRIKVGISYEFINPSRRVYGDLMLTSYNMRVLICFCFLHTILIS